MQKLLFLYIAIVIFIRPAVPAFVYFLNYDYISKTLCENKNKPQEHCNGHCYLNKNISKDIQENHKGTSNTKSVEVVDFIAICDCQKWLYPTSKITTKENKYFAIYSENYTFNYNSKIFHPPSKLI